MKAKTSRQKQGSFGFHDMLVYVYINIFYLSSYDDFQLHTKISKIQTIGLPPFLCSDRLIGQIVHMAYSHTKIICTRLSLKLLLVDIKSHHLEPVNQLKTTNQWCSSTPTRVHRVRMLQMGSQASDLWVFPIGPGKMKVSHGQKTAVRDQENG